MDSTIQHYTYAGCAVLPGKTCVKGKQAKVGGGGYSRGGHQWVEENILVVRVVSELYDRRGSRACGSE